MSNKKYYAPDPNNNLKRPEDWHYIKTEPWIAMDSNGSWFSYTHKPVFDNHSGMFDNPKKLDEIIDSTRIRLGSYPKHHFSEQVCLDSIYRYIKPDKNNYCPICDGYGGTLQVCQGCGRPANSPCAVSLDGSLENKKKILLVFTGSIG